MKVKSYVVVAAFALGGIGFGAAWYLAATSKDVEFARKQISESADTVKEFGKVEGLVLVGFRISSERSYLTFWMRGASGKKLATFVVNKRESAWTLERQPE